MDDQHPLVDNRKEPGEEGYDPVLDTPPKQEKKGLSRIALRMLLLLIAAAPGNTITEGELSILYEEGTLTFAQYRSLAKVQQTRFWQDSLTRN